MPPFLVKDVATQNKFTELRAQGLSYDKIAETLPLAKATVVNWSRKFEFQIKNLRAIHEEALREKYLLSYEARLKSLGNMQNRVEEELAKRDLSELPTSRLIALASMLRKEMAAEGQLRFSAPNEEIPAEEQVQSTHEWEP